MKFKKIRVLKKIKALDGDWLVEGLSSDDEAFMARVPADEANLKTILKALNANSEL